MAISQKMPQNKNFQNKTDEELVKLTLGDQDNFVYLVNRYQEKLLRYILRISNVSMQEAEDVLQEVFIKIYRNLNDFNGKMKFSSWAYRITRNEAISNFRKNKSRNADKQIDIEDDILERIADDFDIEHKIDNNILRNAIERVLFEMDKKYREVLVLKFFEDKDYKEISDIVKKPMGTVATWLNRAKKEFSKEVKRQNIKNSLWQAQD